MQKPISRLPRNPEIVGHAELRKHTFDLKGPLDSQPADHVRPTAGNVAAAKEYSPAARTEQTGYEIEEGGFSCAVRSNDGMDPATGKTNAEIVDRSQAAKPFCQILGSQDSVAHGSACSVNRSEAAARSSSRVIQSFHRPTIPFGAKITARIANSPTSSE